MQFLSLQRHRLFILLSAIFLFFAGAQILSAQAPTGRILGTVTDPRGYPVAKVQVVITEVSTDVGRQTETDETGHYQILDLPIGTYKVAMAHDSFRQLVFDNQVLQINQSLRIDGKMELGGRTETIEIVDQVSVVETVDATMGSTVSGRTLLDAPLNGRNTLDLALLQPGVTPSNPDDTSAGTYNISGGRSDSVTFLLDGGQNNDILGNAVVFNPNPDTIAEFRILENNYTAEYGRNGGGIISEVTKSGTNEYHGSAFDFIRNGDLNANKFFNKNDLNNLLPRDTLRRNQVGGTFGGPITIPHVIHGRDRFFFFVGYQQQIQSDTESPGAAPVFTTPQLAGDFSGTGSNPATGFCPNFDPNVASFLQNNPFFQSNPTLAGCAVIDPAKINTVAQKYIAAGLIPSSTTGFVNPQAAGTNNTKELTLRFDFNISQRDRLSATLGGSHNPEIVPFPTANVGGFGSIDNTKNYFTNFAYTHTFTPNVLNEFRVTTQRNNRIRQQPESSLPGPAELGFTNITPDQTTGPPLLFFDSTGLTLGFSPNGPTTEIQNAFIYSDVLSWTHGRHTFKFGGGFSAYQSNIDYDFYVNGAFDFVGDGGIGTGNDLADFLTGQPIDYFQAPKAATNARTKLSYGFAQDEWRVKSGLTLTLGVRYEYSTPKIDTHGYTFNVIPNQQSTVFPNAPLGLVFPGDHGAPRGVNFPDKNNWAPRIGFAWDPKGDGKTSIRGGFGVFYDILKAEDNLQDNGQPPFFSSAFLFYDPLAANPASELQNLADPFSTADIPIPNPFPSKPVNHNIDFGAAGFLPFGSTAIYLDDPHLRTPYIYQYNLSVQRQIAPGTALEIGYLGSSSHGLTSLVDINPFILGTDTRVLNANQPEDIFTNLPEFKNVSKASYNGLSASIRRTVADRTRIGTVYFTLAYTFAHSIDNTSGFRNRNSGVPAYEPNAFRASSDFDVRHRITFSGGWDLPFDRMFQSAPSRLTKGWSVFPIFSWRTGFPLDIFSSTDSSGGYTNPGTSGEGDPFNVHANLVGPITTFDPHHVQTLTSEQSGANTGNFYFNPAAFSTAQCPDGSTTVPNLPNTCIPSGSLFPASSQVIDNPSLATYGTLPRNFLRGPGYTNLDMSISKTTALFGERLKLEIRGDFFNIFNHTEFQNPNLTITSSQFGQVTSTYDPRIIQLAARFSF